MADRSEIVDRLAATIFEFGWLFDGEHGTPEHARYLANLVAADLGLEHVGWLFPAAPQETADGC